MVKAWAVTNNKAYNIDISGVKAYSASTMAADMGAMTTGTDMMDVIGCPLTPK